MSRWWNRFVQKVRSQLCDSNFAKHAGSLHDDNCFEILNKYFILSLGQNMPPKKDQKGSAAKGAKGGKSGDDGGEKGA